MKKRLGHLPFSFFCVFLYTDPQANSDTNHWEKHAPGEIIDLPTEREECQQTHTKCHIGEIETIRFPRKSFPMMCVSVAIWTLMVTKRCSNDRQFGVTIPEADN